MSKLVFGCGYLGGRVARRWVGQGAQVHALTRSDRHAKKLREDGIIPIVGEITEPDTLTNLPPATTVLFAVGYDRTSGKTIEQVYVDGLGCVLDALPPLVRRFIHVSSTGVYGQSDGSWVDEDSSCQPTRAGGRACLAAEQLLSQHEIGQHAIILRMAGIYGPGRVPRQDELRRGTPIPAPMSGHLNLIHVEDAAQAVLAAETAVDTPRTYVISDGHPVQRRDYLREVARLAGVDEPHFCQPSADSPKAQRASGDKRISNLRMLKELNLRLAYPNYLEGVRAIFAENG